MTEGGSSPDNIFQKAANWAANKLAPGGFPTVPETGGQYYPDPSPNDPKPRFDKILDLKSAPTILPSENETKPENEIDLTTELLASEKVAELANSEFSGVITSEGKLIWTRTATTPWQELAKESNYEILASVSQYKDPFSPKQNKLHIRTKDDTVAALIYQRFVNLLPENQTMQINHVLDLGNYARSDIVFDGPISEASALTNLSFIKALERESKLGYQEFSGEIANKALGDLWRKIKSQGKFMVVRWLGTPVLPTQLSSGVLASPGDVEVFDAHIHPDLGAIIYSVDANSAPLAFDQDARTNVFTGDENEKEQFLKDSLLYKRKDIGNQRVYWRVDKDPISLDALEAHNESPDQSGWNEVIIDPHSPNAQIVGIWNYSYTTNWKDTAKSLGVPEFRCDNRIVNNTLEISLIEN